MLVEAGILLGCLVRERVSVADQEGRCGIIKYALSGALDRVV